MTKKPKINLEKLSLAELKTLAKDIDQEIASKENSRRSEALEALAKTAAKHGYALKDLIGTPKRKSTSKKPVPKYANPSDPSETWSGRGRQPEWYKAALKSGKSPETMLIG